MVGEIVVSFIDIEEFLYDSLYVPINSFILIMCTLKG